MAQSIGRANLNDLAVAVLPHCLKNGTNPATYTDGVFPTFRGEAYNRANGTGGFTPTLANGATYNDGAVIHTPANAINTGWTYADNLTKLTTVIWMTRTDDIGQGTSAIAGLQPFLSLRDGSPGNFSTFRLSMFLSGGLPYQYHYAYINGDRDSYRHVGAVPSSFDYSVKRMYAWVFDTGTVKFYSGSTSLTQHTTGSYGGPVQNYIYGPDQPILIGSNNLGLIAPDTYAWSEDGFEGSMYGAMFFLSAKTQGELEDLFALDSDLGGLAGYDNGDGTLDLVDVTAPSWATGYPLISASTGSTAGFKVKTDEDATAYFVVLQDGATAPSSLQVTQGKDSNGNAVPSGFYGSTVLSANVEGDLTSSNLTHSLSYDAYFTAQDDSTNLQATPVKVDFTTQDLSAPGWYPGSPFLYGSTSSSAQFKAAINEAGTIYFETVLASSPNPDSTQVKLGLDGGDSSALVSASSSVLSGQLATFSVTGLNPGTYNSWFVAEDGSGNLQTSPAGLRFTIEAPRTIPIYAARRTLVGNTLGDRFY